MKINRCGQATPLDSKTFQLILDSFRSESHRLFWAIAWYSGERPSAILKMLVGHIYQNAAKRIPRENMIFPLGNRKDKATREVPIAQKLDLFLRRQNIPQTGFLFPSLAKPGDHLSLRVLDKALRRALKRCGLENQGYSLYSARRGFVTSLDRSGKSIKVIQSLTGHKNLSSLQRYIEVSDEQRKNAIDSI